MTFPRDYRNQSLDDSFATAFLVTPNDSQDLAKFPVGLRIWNPNAGPATVQIDTVGGSVVTLTVPGNKLTLEPIHTAKVYATGTTAGLVIHGLF